MTVNQKTYSAKATEILIFAYDHRRARAKANTCRVVLAKTEHMYYTSSGARSSNVRYWQPTGRQPFAEIDRLAAEQLAVSEMESMFGLKPPTTQERKMPHHSTKGRGQGSGFRYGPGPPYRSIATSSTEGQNQVRPASPGN